jgi:hypothetical protein
MMTSNCGEEASGGCDDKKKCAPLCCSAMAIWLPTGVAIGTAIGVATDDLGTWIAVGVALGAALGCVGTAVRAKREKSK